MQSKKVNMMNGLSFIEYLCKFGKTEEYSWGELAQIYGFGNGNSARNAWLRYRQSTGQENMADKIQRSEGARAAATGTYIGELEDIIESYINYDKGEAKVKFSNNSEALSDEEVYQECKLDVAKWKLTQLWQKKQANGAFTYSASFRPVDNNAPEKVEEAFTQILQNYISQHKPLVTSQLLLNNRYTNPTCCLFALTDVHLDKQTNDGQTIESKVEQYHRVLDVLLHKAYTANLVDEIVFTVGHDLFNTDTYYKTTTNGTQQANNMEWDQSYEVIFDSQVKAINKLKQFCNKLHIKYIPSNHARTKEYFLVHALEIYFKGDKNIIFDRSSESTKVYTYGENFIGLHHGDHKLEKLPTYFSQKYYKEWGTAKYKSICVGDKHVRKSWNTSSSEVEGVRIYQTPHMGGYGQWDKSMMFENGIQSGICMVFDKLKGRIMEIEEQI